MTLRHGLALKCAAWVSAFSVISFVQAAPVGLALGLSTLQPEPAIEHDAVACVVADRFPRFVARFPGTEVAIARIVFQGSSPDWYSVTMKPEGGSFAGVLPKPLKSLKAVTYYIEVTERTLATNRTRDYVALVVGSPGACSKRAVAGTVPTASILMQNPPGVVALPAGFAPSGVITGSAAPGAGLAGAGAAGAAGLSAGAVTAIVGGVAGAAALAKAAGRGGETSSGAPGSPTGSAPPSPTPAPGFTFAGHWAGTVTFPPSPASPCPFSQPFNMDVTQTGATLAGTAALVRSVTTPVTPLCQVQPPVGSILSAQLTEGTLNGSNLAFTAQFAPFLGAAGFAWTFTGTLSGNSASGSVQNATETGTATGTWTVSR